MYRLYREFVQINLERKEATHFVIDFIQKVYDFILEYKEFAKSINLEVLKLIDKKIIDFSSKEEKNKIESSLFY